MLLNVAERVSKLEVSAVELLEDLRTRDQQRLRKASDRLPGFLKHVRQSLQTHITVLADRKSQAAAISMPLANAAHLYDNPELQTRIQQIKDVEGAIGRAVDPVVTLLTDTKEVTIRTQNRVTANVRGRVEGDPRSLPGDLVELLQKLAKVTEGLRASAGALKGAATPPRA